MKTLTFFTDTIFQITGQLRFYLDVKKVFLDAYISREKYKVTAITKQEYGSGKSDFKQINLYK